MIRILDGSGYHEDGELDKDILAKRLDMEDFGKKLSVYFIHMDLRKGKRKADNFTTNGSLCFLIKRYGQ